MHRSGTSCLTGSLQHKGLHLGEVPEWNEHNRKGNRENTEIAELNEAVLNYNKGSWHQPPANLRWKRSHAKRRNEIVERFEKERSELWGFKDPRVTLALPFWQEAIPTMEYVGTFRHPLLVAQSLNKRDNMPIDYALNVWCGYNECMLEQFRKQRFPIISFDLDADDYLVCIDQIAIQMTLPEPNGKAFLDKALKSTEIDAAENKLSQRVTDLYAALQAACLTV